MAARSGFEPKLTESESAVLPLHHRANYSLIQKWKPLFSRKIYGAIMGFMFLYEKFCLFFEEIKFLLKLYAIATSAIFYKKLIWRFCFFRDRRFRRKFLSAIPICFLLLFMHFFNLISLCKNLIYRSIGIISVGFVKIFSNLTFVVTSAKGNEMRNEVLYLISLKVIISGVSYMW